MTDDELLERAARAAGLQILRDPSGVLRDCTADENPARNIYSFPVWMPLTDAGDAMRLMVKLRMSVSYQLHKLGPIVVVYYRANEAWHQHKEFLWDPSGEASTRRAIVCAAAASAKIEGDK